MSGKKKLAHHQGEFTALKDITFEVNKGDFFGIVGRNGCGKSTLLKILAGVYTPTRGEVGINGNLTPFIELGVGFNPELSGRDNVFLNGALLGFSRRHMEEMYNDIVDFAELHDFMETKLKNYSSGMQVRLAFSIAIRAKSDILLIDEVLAVGDAAFQQKCFEYFRNLKENRHTVVLVSHDRSVIEQYCTKAILIDDKKLVAKGRPVDVFNKYEKIIQKQVEGSESVKDLNSSVSNKRLVTGQAEIIKLTINSNKAKSVVLTPNNVINLTIEVVAKDTIIEPVYGIIVARKGEFPIFATNTIISGSKTKSLNPGDVQTVKFVFNNVFRNGTYYISPAVATFDVASMIDWRDNMGKFTVVGQKNTYSLVNIDHTIELL